MRSNPVEKIGYPVGFVLIFSFVYFVLQILLGFYVKQSGIADDFVAEMIRDHELSIQVISLLVVLFLFENIGGDGAWKLWPTKLWHSIQTFLFPQHPDPHPNPLHPESPWMLMFSGLFRGLLLAAVSVGVFRFLDGSPSIPAIFRQKRFGWFLPYFFSQSLLFILWFVLIGKVRRGWGNFWLLAKVCPWLRGRGVAVPVCDAARLHLF